MEEIPLRASSAAEPESLVDRIEEAWDEGAAVAVYDPTLTPAELPKLPPSVPAGVALVLGTSGTTGRPKAVALSRAAVEAAVRLTNEAVGAEPGDRWLCCLPASAAGGLMTLLRSRALGTDAVVVRRFDITRFAAPTGARFLSVVPTMLSALLHARADLSRFDRILVGGARAGDDLMQRASQQGVAATETYGMTETCGGIVYDGLPLSGVEVGLREGGRIALRSPTLMSGYLGDAAETEAVLDDGWFLTRDRGVFSGDGRLRVLGRLDDAIVTGGKKVDPAEVARVLEEHHAISEALVRGEPDDEWGERVTALVVVALGADSPTLKDLHRFLEGRLGRYKWPRSVRVVDRLPKS